MKARCLIVLASLSFSGSAAWGATFTVTTTSDGGAGSFRQAILDANAASGKDTIAFQIPGVPPFTILPTLPLPALTDPVVIDATTQPGYVDRPAVEINGSLAGGGAVGLRVGGGSNTVRGLAISGFSADGIRLDSSGNAIQGNYIGTDVTGLIGRGNAQYGVFVLSTSSNLIGGTNRADRNVISGGNETGVYILNGTANVVQGNYIGVNAAGLLDLGNHNNGVTIFNGSDNTIGGVAPGARNVIAGNDGSGINLNAAGATGNVIQGNYIGVAANAILAVGNATDGITLNGASGNLIGGTNSGARNLISGNGQAGIFLNVLNTAVSAANRIEGNYIGTDAAGSAAQGNGLAGITLLGAPSNTIGGVSVEARNVISGNRQEGLLLLTNSAGNRVQGNYIGVTASGTGRLGNAFQGVAINSAAFNLIGGAAPDAGNVISGNTNIGVWLFGASASNNVIQRNLIGTDATGNTAIGNSSSGMLVEAPGNLIGGGEAGAGNVISGNNYIGIWLLNSNATGNRIQGNLIGTTLSGTSALGNLNAGVGITDAANNQIGGTTPAERNVISKNGFPVYNGGVFIVGSAAVGNRFMGNFIGTDATGQNEMGNCYEGIYLNAAGSNIIGGTVPGAGNLISGNGLNGITLTNSSWNQVAGNRIGTRNDGISALGNSYFGIEIDAGCYSNTIGGLDPDAGNKIAFSGLPISGGRAGVRIRSSAVNNAILGNAIFSNASLGIAFSGFSPTANDDCDGDSGGNLLQNAPEITQVFSGVQTVVHGTLNGMPNTVFRIQFFASPSCDPSGNGEGHVFLGDTTMTTDGACSNSFVAILPIAAAPGNVITATATDPANNTSEFSTCATVQALPPSPRLAIDLVGSQILLAWTSTAACFVLKESGSLSPPIQWTTVTDAPVETNGRFLVTLPRQPGNHFYRLAPCGEPPLSPLLEISSIASNQISLAWTTTATGFVLKETDSLSPPAPWSTVTNAPVISGGKFVVNLALQPGNRYYRLRLE